MEPLILVPNSYRESIGQNKRNAQWENSVVISLNSTTKRKSCTVVFLLVLPTFLFQLVLAKWQHQSTSTDSSVLVNKPVFPKNNWPTAQ